jgi:hypothetical protein
VAASIRTEIEIEAPPERVWQILTDFAAYQEWNPFIPRLAGEAAAGARLDVFLQPPGGRGMGIRPTVLAAAPHREFRWLGHLGVPGLFDGEHIFRLEPLGPERIRFVQEERFAGILAPLVLRFIGASTRRGFIAMNEALKTRAEQSA